MEKSNFAKDFDAVDQTNDPVAFINLLDTISAIDWFKKEKLRTFELLMAKEGDYLLDVGCGTGEDVCTLVQYVGATGKVIGLDCSSVMLIEAKKEPMNWSYQLSFIWVMCINLSFPVTPSMVAVLNAHSNI
jgi:ubiquinone/menaquinone biosynthesis C-methylase UbiE